MAAALLRDCDELDESTKYELLHARVIAHFQRSLSGEAHARAVAAWYEACRNGSWTFESSPGALTRYLRMIGDTARTHEFHHHRRKIARYTTSQEPTSVGGYETAEDTATETSARELAAYWADRIEGAFHTPEQGPHRPSIECRSAIVATMFPDVEYTKITEGQCRVAIKLAKEQDLGELALRILVGDGDAADHLTAARAWPFLQGQPGWVQREVLGLWADRFDREDGVRVILLMCNYDRPRRGPDAGQQPDYMTKAANRQPAQDVPLDLDYDPTIAADDAPLEDDATMAGAALALDHQPTSA